MICSIAFILNIKVALSAFLLFTYKKVLIFIWILQKSKLMCCKVTLDNYSIKYINFLQITFEFRWTLDVLTPYTLLKILCAFK